MTSIERLLALTDATRYITLHHIQGAVVECGVWKGGSMMAAALTLLDEGDEGRDLYLFDTFDGMSPPTEIDREYTGRTAEELLSEDSSRLSHYWAVSSLEEVKLNMATTNYPADHIHYIEGDVCSTVPRSAPQIIALLRLDTDWYESTRHELRHLLPRLAHGGVLIIDDYGHYEGARKAVDEYLAETGIPILLTRIDYTGRMAVVP